jgi:HAD superfamily hydrolase (TIGR01459 family)
VHENLIKWGVVGSNVSDVITSGDVTRNMINQFAIDNKVESPKIFHLGEDRNNDLLSNMKCTLTEDIDDAEIFVLSLERDEHENIHAFDELLKKASKKRNMLSLCANPDTTIPKNGIIRYCAGYFAHIFEQHGGIIHYTGKPKSEIYNMVFNRAPGISKNRILMIGDTVEKDILGASSAGIDSALVMTGNSVKIHDAYDDTEEKMSAILRYTKAINTVPTFVTELT